MQCLTFVRIKAPEKGNVSLCLKNCSAVSASKGELLRRSPVLSLDVLVQHYKQSWLVALSGVYRLSRILSLNVALDLQLKAGQGELPAWQWMQEAKPMKYLSTPTKLQ